MGGGTKRLEVVFGSNESDFIRGKNKVASEAESLGSKVSSVLGGSALAVGAAAVAAIGGLSITLMGAYNAAQESAKVTRETERVIKSTGGAAHVTAGEVAGLAKSFSDQTGISGRLIRSTENLLLTFTQVKNQVGEGNDIFNQATKAAFDMSTVLGTDASGAAIQLGKALNDPIKGITALSRAGVSFTAQQKDQIKAMVESGNVLGAQKIILKELSTEFGGAAEAASTPLEKLQTKIAAIPAIIGGYLVPAVNVAATWLGDRLPGAISAATSFITDHAEALKYLASVALAGLATAYVPVIAAQVAMVGSNIIGFISTLIGYVVTLGAIFVETAAAEGIFAAVTGTLSMTLLPLAPALALIGGLIYGLVSSFDNSSESANTFFDSVQAQVDTSSFESINDAVAKVDDRIAHLTKSISDQSNSLGDVGFAIADLLIPWHDLTGSIFDQEDELITLKDLQAKHTAALRESQQALFDVATQSVLAAHGMDTNRSSSLGLTGANAGLNAEIQTLYRSFATGGMASAPFVEALAVIRSASAGADEKLKAFKDELNLLFGVHIAAAQAANTFGASLDVVAQKVTANTDLTDIYHASNREASGAVMASVDAALKYAVSLGEEDGNLIRATGSLETNRTKLLETMMATGMSEQKAKDYIATLNLTPEMVATLIQVNKDAAEAAANALRRNVDELTRARTVTMHADVSQAMGALNSLSSKLDYVAGKMRSGDIAAGGYALGRALVGQANGGITLQQFAEGGHTAQIAKAGAMRLWAEPETGGEAYIPLAGRKRRQSTAILSEVANMFGYDLVGAAGPMNVGRGRTGARDSSAHVHFHLDGGGFIGSEDQLARALDHVMQAGIRKGLRMGGARQ